MNITSNIIINENMLNNCSYPYIQPKCSSTFSNVIGIYIYLFIFYIYIKFICIYIYPKNIFHYLFLDFQYKYFFGTTVCFSSFSFIICSYFLLVLLFMLNVLKL